MGVESGHSLGVSENGALPNITGVIEGVCRAGEDGSTGAFSQTFKHDWTVKAWDTGGAWTTKINFAASSSNSLYKSNQSKVDAANIRVNYIIKW